MKVISIGRNPSCDIVLNSNIISRQHAVLKIYPLGKYEIISIGSNGTKVNGNPIAPNQPYPVKRGDSITFAQSANLDWNLVPNPLKPYKIGVIIGGIVIVFLLIWLFLVPLFATEGEDTVSGGGEIPQKILQPKDSVTNEKTVETPEETPMTKFTFPNENKKGKQKKEDKSDKKNNIDKTSENKKEDNAKAKEEESSVVLPRLR